MMRIGTPSSTIERICTLQGVNNTHHTLELWVSDDGFDDEDANLITPNPDALTDSISWVFACNQVAGEPSGVPGAGQ